MADPREPVDGTGLLSVDEGRALVWRGATGFAKGLPTVLEGRVGWAPERTEGSGPRMTPERFAPPAVGRELRTLGRAPAAGPARERKLAELRVGAAVLPRSPSVGRRVVAAPGRFVPGLAVAVVGRSTPRETPGLVLGEAVRVVVGRARAGAEVVRVGVRVVALGRVRTGVWAVPVLVRGSLAVVARDVGERPVAADVTPVLAAVTEPAAVRRGFSLNVVASGDTTATVRPW